MLNEQLSAIKQFYSTHGDGFDSLDKSKIYIDIAAFRCQLNHSDILQSSFIDILMNYVSNYEANPDIGIIWIKTSILKNTNLNILNSKFLQLFSLLEILISQRNFNQEIKDSLDHSNIVISFRNISDAKNYLCNNLKKSHKPFLICNNLKKNVVRKNVHKYVCQFSFRYLKISSFNLAVFLGLSIQKDKCNIFESKKYFLKNFKFSRSCKTIVFCKLCIADNYGASLEFSSKIDNTFLVQKRNLGYKCSEHDSIFFSWFNNQFNIGVRFITKNESNTFLEEFKKYEPHSFWFCQTSFTKKCISLYLLEKKIVYVVYTNDKKTEKKMVNCILYKFIIINDVGVKTFLYFIEVSDINYSLSTEKSQILKNMDNYFYYEKLRLNRFIKEYFCMIDVVNDKILYNTNSIVAYNYNMLYTEYDVDSFYITLKAYDDTLQKKIDKAFFLIRKQTSYLRIYDIKYNLQNYCFHPQADINYVQTLFGTERLEILEYSFIDHQKFNDWLFDNPYYLYKQFFLLHVKNYNGVEQKYLLSFINLNSIYIVFWQFIESVYSKNTFTLQTVVIDDINYEIVNLHNGFEEELRRLNNQNFQMKTFEILSFFIDNIDLNLFLNLCLFLEFRKSYCEYILSCILLINYSNTEDEEDIQKAIFPYKSAKKHLFGFFDKQFFIGKMSYLRVNYLDFFSRPDIYVYKNYTVNDFECLLYIFFDIVKETFINYNNSKFVSENDNDTYNNCNKNYNLIIKPAAYYYNKDITNIIGWAFQEDSMLI
ncbi:hypothetical protein COBT_000861 [Conglomerata obtusa]